MNKDTPDPVVKDLVAEGYFQPELIAGMTICQPKLSNWQCHLFGTKEYVYQPSKGNVPNWFWRKMQYLILGNRWEKIT